MTGVPIRRSREDRQTSKKGQREREAEMEVMHLQVKEHQRLTATTRN